MKRIFWYLPVYMASIAWSIDVYAAGTDGKQDVQFAPEIELVVPDSALFGSKYEEDEPFDTLYVRKGWGSGEFRQELAFGETVVINDAESGTPLGTFTGSTTLRAKVTFDSLHLGSRGVHKGDTVTGFFGLGVSALDIDMKVTDGVQTLKFNDRSMGASISIGGIYHYNDWFGIEGEGFLVIPAEELFSFMSNSDYVSSMTDMRLRILVKQNKWISYYLGYRLMKFSYVDPNTDSDPAAVRLDLSGTYGGVSIHF